MSALLFGYRLSAEARRNGPPVSEEELLQVRAHVRSLYDNGTPYFNKQHLSNIGHQIAEANRARATRHISVNGLDGVPVDFEVEVGRVSPAIGHPDLDSVVRFAFLSYNTPERLAKHSGNNPTTAYCNLQVVLRVAVQSSILEIQPSRQEAETILNYSRQDWEASDSCRQLREALVTAIAPRSIAKVVGFSCGGFAAQNPPNICDVRSAMQHALLLTLQDIFRGSGHEAQIPCYVQDPVYTDVDKAVLGASGLTVLDDPMGFVEVDDESVVMSLYSDCPIKEIVLDMANPALIIWQETYDKSIKPPELPCDPEGPRVKKRILELYSELNFPAYEEYFGKTRMYV